MKLSCCALAVLSLASCAQMNGLKTATAEGFAKAKEATKSSLAKLKPQPDIPVVKVRDGDLKKVPTGQEQAVAFEKNRRSRFFGIFGGPVDFKEPALPDDGGLLDSGLLPPRIE